jgi:Tol biopolymer transport system component
MEITPMRSSMFVYLSVLVSFTHPASAAQSVAPFTELISVSPTGQPGNQSSGFEFSCDSQGCFAWICDPAISADGRFVAFWSEAGNLTTPTTTSRTAYYLRDRATGSNELISVSATGAVPNLFFQTAGSGLSIVMTPDARYVVYTCAATNLVPGDTNGKDDVFLRDRVLGTTTRVSVANGGAQVHGHSGGPSMSADGRFICFWSDAHDVVPGDTNNTRDVFVHDRTTNQTERVSVATGGAQITQAGGGLISADGKWVVFGTADALVLPDAGHDNDLFLYERATAVTTRVSWSTTGTDHTGWAQGGKMSADGRFVVFASDAPDMVMPPDPGITSEVYRYDRLSNSVERVTFSSPQFNANANPCDISADGQRVLFNCAASGIVPGDTNGGTDLFVRDFALGTYQCVDVSLAGVPSSAGAAVGTFSADGRVVSFLSSATDMIAGQLASPYNIFVRDLGFAGSPQTYCTAATNSLGCTPTIGATGIASASAPSGFLVTVGNVLNQRFGVILYSITGPRLAPFSDAWMCIAAPVKRTGLRSTGGSPSGVDCSGSLALDFNAWRSSGADPSLVVGTEVWLQGWTREPTASTNTHMSPALHFALAP